MHLANYAQILAYDSDTAVTFLNLGTIKMVSSEMSMAVNSASAVLLSGKIHKESSLKLYY